MATVRQQSVPSRPRAGPAATGPGTTTYVVMVSDRHRPCDAAVDSRVNRRSALALATRLNRGSVERHGPHGPLYYVERVESALRDQRRRPPRRRVPTLKELYRRPSVLQGASEGGQ